jgi:hypothetical protein
MIERQKYINMSSRDWRRRHERARHSAYSFGDDGGDAHGQGGDRHLDRKCEPEHKLGRHGAQLGAIKPGNYALRNRFDGNLAQRDRAAAEHVRPRRPFPERRSQIDRSASAMTA